jgi:hypothetical protein
MSCANVIEVQVDLGGGIQPKTAPLRGGCRSRLTCQSSVDARVRSQSHDWAGLGVRCRATVAGAAAQGLLLSSVGSRLEAGFPARSTRLVAARWLTLAGRQRASGRCRWPENDEAGAATNQYGAA